MFVPFSVWSVGVAGAGWVCPVGMVATLLAQGCHLN